MNHFRSGPCAGVDESTYNGWKNYETWNVALWISNDETLYNLAKEMGDYSVFLYEMRVQPSIDGTELAKQTPDQVMWSSPLVDIKAINKMIGEL